jgi:IclR family KDG regulon transcriptional repressor
MKTVKNALNVLDLFIEHGDELALEDMSRLSGLNKVTARRVALTLKECGYLRQPQKRGKYSLGMKLLDLSNSIKKNNWVIRVANPYLIELSRQANESVILALWDGMRAVHCQAIKVDHLLTALPEEGTIAAMHNTSIGKAILAEMNDTELQAYFIKGLKRYTPNTITNLNDLKKHLMIVKQEGVAFDNEEFALGVKGIGAVIKSQGGNVIGGISVIGPSVRLTQPKLREYIPLIKNFARRISEQFGCK